MISLACEALEAGAFALKQVKASACHLSAYCCGLVLVRGIALHSGSRQDAGFGPRGGIDTGRGTGIDPPTGMVEGDVVGPLGIRCRIAEPSDCCIVWASSCASKRWPVELYGVYCPAPNTTSLPTVYASAFTTRADSAAWESVCTRTWLKSYPKRDSID